MVAGLRAAAALAEKLGGALPGDKPFTTARLEELAARGEAALAGILPAECVQEDPAKARAYDAALLFLAEPLRLLDPLGA